MLGAAIHPFSGPSDGLILRADDRPEAPINDAFLVEEGLLGSVSWFGASPFTGTHAGSETVVQALSGLMEVHGREQGRPRRIGLEVASVAAGVLAVQGVLAALISRHRGHDVRAVHTSAIEAGLLLVSHYIAIASCGDEGFRPAPGTDPGPPFPTADGHWVELEAIDPDAWKAFWLSLGLPSQEVGRAWALFVQRYETATCSLPRGFHRATGSRTLAELTEIAVVCDVSLSRVRSFSELDMDLDRPPWVIRPGPGSAAPVASLAPARGDPPLQGLRVIEATRRLQGPFAGLLLQMLGAEVVRIEPPGGDLVRMMPPLAGDVAAIFLALNRGKRPVELDPKRPGDRRELLGLLAEADVFLQNWRPGRAAELELEYADCAALNPRLVYAYASGWGDRADTCPRIATDYVVQAHSALGATINPDDELPFPSRLVLADLMGGLIACEGALSALYLRERTGTGCRVESSLLAGALTLQQEVGQTKAFGSRQPRRGGRPVWGRLDRPVETSEGFLVVAADDGDAAARLSHACGLDAATATEDDIVGRLSSASAAAWERPLVAAGVACAEACTDLAALTRDPRYDQMLEPVGGKCVVPTAPWRFDPTSGGQVEA